MSPREELWKMLAKGYLLNVGKEKCMLSCATARTPQAMYSLIRKQFVDMPYPIFLEILDELVYDWIWAFMKVGTFYSHITIEEVNNKKIPRDARHYFHISLAREYSRGANKHTPMYYGVLDHIWEIKCEFSD